jgi:hypothetical protein
MGDACLRETGVTRDQVNRWRKKRSRHVGLWLWRLGVQVGESHWRPRLRRFGQVADWVLPFVLRLRSRVDRNEMGETFQEKAARNRM